MKLTPSGTAATLARSCRVRKEDIMHRFVVFVIMLLAALFVFAPVASAQHDLDEGHLVLPLAALSPAAQRSAYESQA
jgi:hypothetical protein